ncbi:LamG domain-containing protein [Gloeothece verrucosa]|uniref:LamG domain protein jellyroll fold domain protein n=1 Tax=Gloeothece verrucosa (strain PCC 7822) TaxID=497965 RepID=E0UIE4_GLOV7|nr:LamG domain-containing protein [Gloeothece verrucosa]ADN16912.1 LamG domain protein jellyroll fold domain protein [Gloeothece verrucosa PCC 7822]
MMLYDPKTRLECLQSVLEFDGKDDKIEIPYSEILNPTSFTVEAWVMCKGGFYGGMPVSSYEWDAQEGSKGYTLFTIPWLTGENWCEFWIYGTNMGGYSGIPTGFSPSIVQNDVWTHLAGTYDEQSKTHSFYVNGELSADPITIGFEPYKPNRSSVLRIGTGDRADLNPRAVVQLGDSFNPLSCGVGSSKEYFFFKGLIAEVRIWNKARSQKQIQANLYRRLKGNESGLVGYWPLNEGFGNQVKDKTANHNNGKIFGHPTWVAAQIPLDFN